MQSNKDMLSFPFLSSSSLRYQDYGSIIHMKCTLIQKAHALNEFHVGDCDKDNPVFSLSDFSVRINIDR